IEFRLAARLQVKKELRPVCRVSAKHQADDERPARGLPAVKARHLASEIALRHTREQLVVGGRLRSDDGQQLVESTLFRFLDGSLPRGTIEAGLRSLDECRPHETEIPKQFERTALFRCGPVIELRAIELAGKM